jgi:hypothetical protein
LSRRSPSSSRREVAEKLCLWNGIGFMNEKERLFISKESRMR